MKVDNARRLTGRGFFAPGPGAVVELWLEPGDDPAAVQTGWQVDLLGPLLDALGLGQSKRFVHVRDSGLTCAVSAPIDRLLAVADALEWAALSLANLTEVTFVEAVRAFELALEQQANPPLLALQAAARARGVPFLWDDELVSLGLGGYAQVFTPRALPPLETVDWARYGRVPVGLVTGTNGKTTTTRMVAAILSAAGHAVGLSSTDAIEVAGEVIEQGDWTGPGAARKVLRNTRVTAAVLETARGGILRRGLAYEAADAAIVTNIGEDHFGDFGITRIEDMARVKAVVWDGVRPGGKRIVNAGCPVSMAYLERERASAFGAADWVFFGREPASLARHVAAGGEAWTMSEGILRRRARGVDEEVIAVSAIPATLDGVAMHNVDNALAAAALAHALGADMAAIDAGLRSFGSLPADNPGRLERYDVGPVRVLLDFAHNPHGVSALAPVVASLRARSAGARLMVVTGQAGDRTDADIDALALATWRLAPDRVLVRPMRGYERGRADGEVEGLMRSALLALGLPGSEFGLVRGEIEALEQGMAWARPGDVVLVLVHIERDAVRAWLEARHDAVRAR